LISLSEFYRLIAVAEILVFACLRANFAQNSAQINSPIQGTENKIKTLSETQEAKEVTKSRQESHTVF